MISNDELNGFFINKKYQVISNFYQQSNEKKPPENKPIIDAYYINERIDKINDHSFCNLQINHSFFINMGMRDLHFRDIDFKHNTFINCYFKQSRFEDVNFTGCKFINCNFDDIILSSCNFEYAIFENCFIEYNFLKPNLTNKINLRWALCKSMYIQAKKAGFYKDYKKYFFEEKKASCEHEKRIAFYRSNDDSYYKKYSSWDRKISFLKFCRYKVEKYVWGYGESLIRLFITSILIIIFFTLLQTCINTSFIQALQISVSNFTGIGILTENDLTFIVTFERILGLIFIGLFITALYKYINRG